MAAASAIRFWRSVWLPLTVITTASNPLRVSVSSGTLKSSETMICEGYEEDDFDDFRFRTVTLNPFSTSARMIAGPRLPSAPSKATFEIFVDMA